MDAEPTLQRRGWSRRHSDVHPALLAIKWLVPMWFAMFGFYLQSVGLHYATYSYVHSMMELSHEERWHNFTTLTDGDAALGPSESVNLHALDSFAALFPMLFMAFSAIRPQRTLQVWVRVMVCAGFLFAIKGLMGAVTTVPDSNGWPVCKGRLKENGLMWMKETHGLVDMFFVDFQWVFQYHTPLRYCSDMMYSGHTFVVTLFAMGCYEVLRIELAPGHVDEFDAIKKALALSLLSFCAILEQALEIYFVLRSRFHYTSDVIVALLLVFLFYTNASIAIFAKQWELKGPFLFIDPILDLLGVLGIRDDSGLHDKSGVVGKTMSEKDFRSKHVMVSRGDIFTPPCCVPCCCYAGRAHVYSDKQIYEIALSSRLDDNEDNDVNLHELVNELNLMEGISLRDVKLLLGIGRDAEPEMTATDSLVIGEHITPAMAKRSLITPDLEGGQTLCGFLTGTPQGKWTPLHFAALTGGDQGNLNPKHMQHLHATDEQSRTPLHIAAFYNQVNIAKELLKAGASFDARMCNGRTPLHLAAKSGGAKVAEELLRAHADPEVVDEEGNAAADLTQNKPGSAPPR